MYFMNVDALLFKHSFNASSYNDSLFAKHALQPNILTQKWGQDNVIGDFKKPELIFQCRYPPRQYEQRHCCTDPETAQGLMDCIYSIWHLPLVSLVVKNNSISPTFYHVTVTGHFYVTQTLVCRYKFCF